MEYKDYYKTLGISRDASQDEIQKAYRKLARKYHPDVNKDAAAEQRFKEIGEAYEVLKDPDKRQRYDQFGSAWKQAQQRTGGTPRWEHIDFDFGGMGGRPGGGFDFGGMGGEGFSSFFEMLFGGGRGGANPFEARFRGGRGGQGGFQQQGTDIEAPITLSLEEAARGGPRELTLTDPTTGRRRKVSVNIPKGVRPGQRIRLAGQGRDGAGGGKRGDLYLKVDFAPHPDFRLEGDDVYTELPIAPWEAALGAQAQVKTLNGPVTIRIPPGSSSGQKIRLRAKGFPRRGRRGSDSGDLYAVLRVMVPSKLSAEEQELFERLSEVSDFSPRAPR